MSITVHSRVLPRGIAAQSAQLGSEVLSPVTGQRPVNREPLRAVPIRKRVRNSPPGAALSLRLAFVLRHMLSAKVRAGEIEVVEHLRGAMQVNVEQADFEVRGG